MVKGKCCFSRARGVTGAEREQDRPVGSLRARDATLRRAPGGDQSEHRHPSVQLYPTVP